MMKNNDSVLIWFKLARDTTRQQTDTFTLSVIVIQARRGFLGWMAAERLVAGNQTLCLAVRRAAILDPRVHLLTSSLHCQLNSVWSYSAIIDVWFIYKQMVWFIFASCCLTLWANILFCWVIFKMNLTLRLLQLISQLHII